MGALILKTFQDAGCLAHLLGCRTTGEALIVDPKLGQHASYLRAAERLNLRIVAALDTHTHADHLTDSRAFLDEGVELWLSGRTASQRPHRRVEHGETLHVGELRFMALRLPGHAADALALAGHGLAVTGDTLLAGGLARTDFPGGDPARLFEGVRRLLLTLPDSTVVLPGHGYRGVLFTTIGHERRHNPDLQHADGAAYAESRRPRVDLTPEIESTLEFNLASEPAGPFWTWTRSPSSCAPDLEPATEPDPVERTPEELASSQPHLAATGRWLDVRDEHEYLDEHIPGARSFPLSELGFHLDELQRRGPVVLQCQRGARSLTAARTLQYLGVIREPVSLAGGLQRWKELGLPVESPALARHD